LTLPTRQLTGFATFIAGQLDDVTAAMAVPCWGMLLLCAGIALVDSLWLLVLALSLAGVLQKGVIEPEEAYLERHFGEEYLRYKAKVRRWI